MKKIAIVAGGTLGKRFLKMISRADYIIGVDRGAFWLIEHGISPDYAIGDFDSVTKEQLRIIKERAGNVVEYPSKKDATDLELAIEYAKSRKPIEVWMYGVLGTRFDHSLVGAQLLINLESYNICGYLVDNTNKINIVRRKQSFLPSSEYTYVSFIPFSKEATVSLHGFAYNATNLQLNRGSSLGISNRVIEKTATITVHEGIILAVQSRN